MSKCLRPFCNRREYEKMLAGWNKRKYACMFVAFNGRKYSEVFATNTRGASTCNGVLVAFNRREYVQWSACGL